MTKFEKQLIKMIGTNLKHWYMYELEHNLVKAMSDSNKQKFGRVSEKAVELITGSKKTPIKDFAEGEIKTVSLTDGSRNFLKDRCGNLLTYKLDSSSPYMKLKPYGDNFIKPYEYDLTWEDFLVKVETMYFIFYEKYQPNGPSDVEDATIVNILKFKSSWYKDFKDEFELIQQVADSVDIKDVKMCKEAQSFVRRENNLIVIKRFSNGNKYEWQIFFKDKEVIKHGEFLVDYKAIKPFDVAFGNGNTALDYVYYHASNGDINVVNKHRNDEYIVMDNFFKNVNQKSPKIKIPKATTKTKVKPKNTIIQGGISLSSNILLQSGEVYIVIDNTKILIDDVNLLTKIKNEIINQIK